MQLHRQPYAHSCTAGRCRTGAASSHATSTRRALLGLWWGMLMCRGCGCSMDRGRAAACGLLGASRAVWLCMGSLLMGCNTASRAPPLSERHAVWQFWVERANLPPAMLGNLAHKRTRSAKSSCSCMPHARSRPTRLCFYPLLRLLFCALFVSLLNPAGLRFVGTLWITNLLDFSCCHQWQGPFPFAACTSSNRLLQGSCH